MNIIQSVEAAAAAALVSVRPHPPDRSGSQIESSTRAVCCQKHTQSIIRLPAAGIETSRLLDALSRLISGRLAGGGFIFFFICAPSEGRARGEPTFDQSNQRKHFSGEVIQLPGKLTGPSNWLRSADT